MDETWRVQFDFIVGPHMYNFILWLTNIRAYLEIMFFCKKSLYSESKVVRKVSKVVRKFGDCA